MTRWWEWGRSYSEVKLMLPWQSQAWVLSKSTLSISRYIFLLVRKGGRGIMVSKNIYRWRLFPTPPCPWTYWWVLDDSGLDVTPDVAPVVHVQLVVLEVAHTAGAVLLHLPHVLPQLLSALTNSPANHNFRIVKAWSPSLPWHVLRNVDVTSFQHGRLPENLLSVIEILEGHHNRSTASNVWASLHPGSFRDDNISPQRESLLQYWVYLGNN